MITLMLDTGIRSTELTTLQVKNVHLEEGYMKVMGKGQKERVLPFGSASQKALLKYLCISTTRIHTRLERADVKSLVLRLVLGF